MGIDLNKEYRKRMGIPEPIEQDITEDITGNKLVSGEKVTAWPEDSLQPGEIHYHVDNSVGKEFMEWAETYWRIDKLIQHSLDNSEYETVDYKFLKNHFIDTINDMIRKRF